MYGPWQPWEEYPHLDASQVSVLKLIASYCGVWLNHGTGAPWDREVVVDACKVVGVDPQELKRSYETHWYGEPL